MRGAAGVTFVYLAWHPDFSGRRKVEARRKNSDDRNCVTFDVELLRRQVRGASQSLLPIAVPDQCHGSCTESLIFGTEAAPPDGLNEQDRKEVARSRSDHGAR